MDLWVRSQNRTILTKVEQLIIDCNADQSRWYIISYKDSEESKTYLGTYKNKESAFAILNKIQELLDQIIDPNLTILPILIYEMPKE